MNSASAAIDKRKASAATPLSLAMVGVGKIARDQHIPAILANPEFRLAATVDPSASVSGVPAFPDLPALLSSGPEVDAVCICTPPQARGQIARDAISAGLGVLLEKPPAASVSELKDLADRARAAGVTLFAAWHSRFASMVASAAEWLVAKRIVSGRIVWREDADKWHPGQRWLWEPGGLGVFDPGINAFSILTAIVAETVVVKRAELEVPSNCSTPIAARLELRCGAAPIEVELDFRELGAERWEILLRTDCGHQARLADGGASFAINSQDQGAKAAAEYPALYARFAELMRTRACDVDLRPLQLVEDILLLAKVRPAPAYAGL